MPRIYTTVDNIENYLRERLFGTSVTKAAVAENMTTFRLEDTVYKDGVAQEKNMWWAKFNVYELKEGRGFDGRFLLPNIEKAFNWDRIQCASAIDAYRETFNAVMAEILAKFGKPEESAKSKRKSKKLKMPKRSADAERWVTAWEKLEPALDADPTLRKDMYQLIEFTGMKEDTIRKIIQLGKAKGIPSRAEFERAELRRSFKA